MPGGPVRAMLPDGRRQHFQHGPIDLVIEAWGAPAERRRAYDQAWARFTTILDELVAELPLLRRPVDGAHPGVEGAVARRMLAACQRLVGGPLTPAVSSRGEGGSAWSPAQRPFITPMAAVAGAVADEVLAALVAARRLERAYVNNGGDIALHLAPGTQLAVGLVAELDRPAVTGTAMIDAAWPVRGVATSGWRGRSFSLGIADAATVLAADAAAADAAATLVANAVDVEHPAVGRRPASALDETSDLGDRLVTVAVGALPPALCDEALRRGAEVAENQRRAGLIRGAVLVLQGRCRVVGPVAPRLAPAA